MPVSANEVNRTASAQRSDMTNSEAVEVGRHRIAVPQEPLGELARSTTVIEVRLAAPIHVSSVRAQ